MLLRDNKYKKTIDSTSDKGLVAIAGHSVPSCRVHLILVFVLALLIISERPAESFPLPGGESFPYSGEGVLTGLFGKRGEGFPFVKESGTGRPNQGVPFESFVSADSKPVSDQKAEQHAGKAKPGSGKWTESNSFHISLLIVILILGALVVWDIASDRLYLKNNPYHKEMRMKIREQNEWLKMMKNKKDKTEQEEAKYKLMKYLKYR